MTEHRARLKGPARLISLLCVALLSPPNVAWSADFDMTTLMQQLAQVRVQHGTFVERKYIGILQHPIESSGELVYRAPDHLEKRTLLPKPESLVLEGDMLTLTRNGRQQTVWLYRYPDLGTLVDSVRGILAGDQKALEAAFEVRLEGSEDQWKVELTPKLEDAQKLIDHIEVRGSRRLVHLIEIVQPDHDRSVMTIENSATPP